MLLDANSVESNRPGVPGSINAKRLSFFRFHISVLWPIKLDLLLLIMVMMMMTMDARLRMPEK